MQLYEVNDDIDVEESPLNDSLTSLQWLTVVNSDDILDGKTSVPYTPPSPAPSSEEGDDKCLTRLTRDIRLCVDNCRKDCPVKPPYSYAELIIMAIKSNVSGKMTLRDIYKWITDNFPFYRKAESSWKNSIRHNLSLSQCFVKIPRKKGDPGKGGYWSIVPEFANMKLLKRTIRKRHSLNVFNYDVNSLSKHQQLDQIETEHKYSVDKKLEKTFERSENKLSDTLPNTYLDARKFDDENISALANRLEEEMSASNTGASMIPSFVNTFAGAIRTDCIWSSELNDSYSQGMSKMTNELLEARGIRINDSGVRNTKDNHNTEDALLKTLSNSTVISDTLPPVFCLSPPLSDDDEEFAEKFPQDLYQIDY